MAVVLDSDVVVGFLDRGDALHQAADAAIRELAADQALLVSVITYAEVLTGARRGHHAVQKAEGFFAEVISEILPVDVAIAERAAVLRADAPSLRMPDALILASAELAPKVDQLVSADRGLAKLRGARCRVKLISP